MIMTSFSFQLVGNIAPTLSNLVDWLQQNSSYDVAEESTAFVRSKVCYFRFGEMCNKIGVLKEFFGHVQSNLKLK